MTRRELGVLVRRLIIVTVAIFLVVLFAPIVVRCIAWSVGQARHAVEQIDVNWMPCGLTGCVNDGIHLAGGDNVPQLADGRYRKGKFENQLVSLDKGEAVFGYGSSFGNPDNSCRVWAIAGPYTVDMTWGNSDAKAWWFEGTDLSPEQIWDLQNETKAKLKSDPAFHCDGIKAISNLALAA